MRNCAGKGIEAVRFATPDSLEGYSAAAMQLQPGQRAISQLLASRTLVDARSALEEEFFLGLRMNRGVSLPRRCRTLWCDRVAELGGVIAELSRRWSVGAL